MKMNRSSYKYINRKTKCKETMDTIVERERIYQIAEELRIMKESFTSVLTKEEAFLEPNMAVVHEGSQEVVVWKQEVDKLLGSLDVQKAMEPDGV